MDEFWDLLDCNRKRIGKTHKRGEPLPKGYFHLVVRAWIINNDDEILILRRDFSKVMFPGMWEVPSGSVMTGENSLEAIIRETKEESGILLSSENAMLFSKYHRYNNFYDCWLFHQDFNLNDVVFQEGETFDARAVTQSTISAMMENGEFIGRDVFTEFELLSGII